MAVIDVSPESVSGDETTTATTEAVVTWQVLIWVLLTLAINSIAQPGRNTCLTHPSKYRMYLCISPIVCVIDTGLFVWSVFLARIRFGVSFVAAIRYVRVRITDSAWIPVSTSVDQMANAGNWHWPRAAMFIIGTLPAIIKLLSFSGIPWSKAWGLMYTMSFIINEFFNIYSTRQSEESTLLEDRTLEILKDPKDMKPDSVLDWDLIQVYRQVMKLETGALLTAVPLQMLILFWATHSVIKSTLFGPLTGLSYEPKLLLGVLYAASVALFLILIMLMYATKLLKIHRGLISIKTLAYGFFIYVLLFHQSPFYRERLYEEHHSVVRDWNLWLSIRITQFCVFFLVFCVLYIILLLGCSIPRVGKFLLVIPSTEVSSNDKESSTKDKDKAADLELDGVFFLTLFVFQLGLAITWYGLAYDPAGTHIPGWTSVFG